MSCEDLARSTSFLANAGFLRANEKVLTPYQTKQVNALLATSGMYDEAGSFAFKVGLPGKSGVGGGIAAKEPDAFQYGFRQRLIAVILSQVAALTSLSERITGLFIRGLLRFVVYQRSTGFSSPSIPCRCLNGAFYFTRPS